MEECKFCKDYELTKRVNLREIRESEKAGIKRRFKYKAMMVECPERFNYSWMGDVAIEHAMVRLVYCPVCGRKLE